MIPKSKNNFRFYYSLDTIKCINNYQENVITNLYNVSSFSGFNIESYFYDNSSNTVCVTYKFEYNDTYEQSKSIINLINTAIRENISELKTDYQKARWAYEWVIENVNYDKTLKNHSAYNGLFGSGTVCSGYSIIYNIVANKLGLDCMYIDGSVYNGDLNYHAWNLIKINNSWYCIDTTWADTDKTENRDKYFLKSKDTFLSDEYGRHNSDVYNNYILAGEVFSETDYIYNTSLEKTTPISPSVYNVVTDVFKTNTLKVCETYNFIISNPENIKLHFKSSNSKIAKVDKNGKIIAKRKGTAVITVYNNDLNIEQSCIIKVG